MTRSDLNPAHLVWAMGSLCALNRVPFDAELLLKQFPPPCTTDHLVHAARALGFRVKLKKCSAPTLVKMPVPCMALISGVQTEADAAPVSLALVTSVTPERIQYFEAGSNTPSELTLDAFAQRYLGQVLLATKQVASVVLQSWWNLFIFPLSNPSSTKKLECPNENRPGDCADRSRAV